MMISNYLNDCISKAFGWGTTGIEWLSPLRDDDYAEYYDQEFLERIGVNDLRMPLQEFWPKSGPRWDGLARTKEGKLILVEAKAHIEEAVDYRSKASANALARIEKRLDEAKSAFRANPNAPWYSPLFWNAVDSSLACKVFVAVQVKIKPVDATQFIQKAYEMPHESYAQSVLLGAIHV